jgi:uncharacterized repeat protein (TIGR03803 family)
LIQKERSFVKTNRAFIQTLAQSGFAVLALAVLTIGSAGSAQSATYKVIHQFNITNGEYPSGNVVFDASGNLYGVTMFGGKNTRGCSEGCGTVFKLSQNSAGQWQQTALYLFSGGTGDGIQPEGSLALDAAGNLYGTTYAGGLNGWGTVYKLSPTSSGGLVLDAAGNLFGTTTTGGTDGLGAIFELSPVSGGGWTESVLYSFTGGNDGSGPQTALILDGAGNLYGTTLGGGNCGGCGTVFKLSPGSGGWTESVLHNFNFTDGKTPAGSLVLDHSGNLYGMTTWGANTVACNVGSNTGCGVVYKLSPNASGGWTYSVLLGFNNRNGAYPVGNLAMDPSGNLWGAAFDGRQNGRRIRSGVHTLSGNAPLDRDRTSRLRRRRCGRRALESDPRFFRQCVRNGGVWRHRRSWHRV